MTRFPIKLAAAVLFLACLTAVAVGESYFLDATVYNKGQQSFTNFGYGRRYQAVSLSGAKGLHVTVDLMSESVTGASDEDSMCVTFLRYIEGYDTNSSGALTIQGGYPVWDSVLTTAVVPIDTSYWVERYITDFDSLMILGVYGILGYQFDFLDTVEDTLRNNPSDRVDTLAFRINVEVVR